MVRQTRVQVISMQAIPFMLSVYYLLLTLFCLACIFLFIRGCRFLLDKYETKNI